MTQRRWLLLGIVTAVTAVAVSVAVVLQATPRPSLHTTLPEPDPQTTQTPASEAPGAEPSPTTSPVPSARVELGSDIQSVIEAHPPGTTFVIAAGVHRLQELQPRNGDRFVGEPGAVLSGARLLDPTDFRREGDRWVIGGQAQEGFVHGSMEPGYERDAHPEDLYTDGRRLQHVESRDAVDAPGEWYLDYERDEIVMADDPSSFDRVEAAAAEFAFVGDGVREVTIENLTVRHYANWAQRGAINGRGSVDWVVRHVEASHNHGLGLGIGAGMTVEHSRFASNGQMGIGGPATVGDATPMTQEGRAVRITSNEITQNGELGYRWRWEGGGSKFVKTRDLVIANNLVTDNDGPGLWYDIDNIDTLVCANHVEGNVVGIFAEISYGTRVAWNLVWNNVRDGEEDASVGILVSGTSGAELFGNVVAGHHAGILGKENDRGDGVLGRYGVADLDVHDNVIADHVYSGLIVETGREEPYETARFDANRWLVADPDARQWEWEGRRLNWDDWNAAGLDTSGELAPIDDAEASLPDGAPQFTRTSYGPLDERDSRPATPEAARCDELVD